MAQELTIDGELYKRRDPLGVWLLSIVTLGIYGLVWYYKVNDEARRFLRDDTIRPGIAVLALFPGALLIVPPFISIYRTAERIVRMEERAQVRRTVEPAIGLLLAFLWGLYHVYYQGHLNVIWDAALAAGAGAIGEVAPPAPPTLAPAPTSAPASPARPLPATPTPPPPEPPASTPPASEA
jgi:Domain of unknown function (DUF4234)